jgi:hypothetical protein
MGLDSSLDERMAGHMHRRFSDPIHIDQLGVLISMTSKPGTQAVQFQGLTPKDDQP